MRTGRVEEANALAQRIGKDIARRCEIRLSKVDGKVDSKGMWAAVRQFTAWPKTRWQSSRWGYRRFLEPSLHLYFDRYTAYQQPSLKSTASLPHTEYLSQWTVFKLLNTLRPTATGFDQLVVHRSWCHIFLQATRPSLQSLHSNINSPEPVEGRIYPSSDEAFVQDISG